MRRAACALAAAVLCAPALAAPQRPAAAQAVAAGARPMLWRLDCGTVDVPDLDFLSDTFVFAGQSRTVTVSCYLIRHGRTWMLWDAGLPLSRLGAGARSVGGGQARLARSLVDQLRTIGVRPDDIAILALSHYHADHAGQAASFPRARLTIGAADWAVVTGAATAFNLDRSLFAPWLTGGAAADAVDGDRDLFGDGTVVMLATPGHTPGHHSLLVRLASGPVVLGGDLWHFREQRAIGGVPRINTSRADTLASMDRVDKVAAHLHARVVIGHDPADIAMLAAFPQGTE